MKDRNMKLRVSNVDYYDRYGEGVKKMKKASQGGRMGTVCLKHSNVP